MAAEQDGRTERELVAAANCGERRAFETLYYRYRGWVYALAVRFCGDTQEANDVLQDAFFYLFNKFPGFRLRARLKTFLYPVVKHLALNRKKKQARSVPLEDLAEEPAAEAARDAASERRSLVELVHTLPEHQREVLLLRYGDGLDLREIAAALEIPVGTVKSRLHNAVATLRASGGLTSK